MLILPELESALQVDRATNIEAAASNQCSLCGHGNFWNHDGPGHLLQGQQGVRGKSRVSRQHCLFSWHRLTGLASAPQQETEFPAHARTLSCRQ